MADYRQIHTHIWKDDWFLDLSPQEKLLFIYLFSNGSTNLVGMYKIALRIIEFETGLPMEFIKQALDKFSQDGKVIYEDGYILVVNMQKYNANSSPKVTARIQYELSEIPDIPLKIRYFSSNIPYRYHTDTLSTLTLTEQNITEQDTTEQSRDNHRSVSSATAISNFNDVDARDCERVCQEITGQPTIPPDQLQNTIELLKFIIPQYDNKQKLHDAGLRHFVRWCNTRGKNGRYYSRINYGWVSWWYDELAPNPGQLEQTKLEYTGALCSTGQALKRKAEDLGDRGHEQAILDYRKHVDGCRICGGGQVQAVPMPDAVKSKMDQLTGKMKVNNAKP